MKRKKNIEKHKKTVFFSFSQYFWGRLPCLTAQILLIRAICCEGVLHKCYLIRFIHSLAHFDYKMGENDKNYHAKWQKAYFYEKIQLDLQIIRTTIFNLFCNLNRQRNLVLFGLYFLLFKNVKSTYFATCWKLVKVQFVSKTNLFSKPFF